MISRNSSRLVFFLRPLYSMSVNVPCFTSFTALICWLYYIIFYRFVHGFDSIRGSLRNPVLILANHHIVIVHKQYIRFFLLCCLPSVSVFFMSVFPILHGFFIRFSFFIIGVRLNTRSDSHFLNDGFYWLTWLHKKTRPNEVFSSAA